MAPSGHRRNLHPNLHPCRILAIVVVVPIKLVGPNTAVFGIILFIPNTAVFGTTNFIGTIASTARMTVYPLDEKGRFLRWPDGAIRKILFIYLSIVNLIYIIFN